MPKDDFKDVVSGVQHTHSIYGTGWPDAVYVCNDEYEGRTYYPVDRESLLWLANLMDCTYKAPDAAHYYAKIIRRALGVLEEPEEPDENICDDCDMHCDLNGAVNCPFGGE